MTANQSRDIYVVGTGTIGEPLTGLLVKMSKPLGIDNVYFHKRTARVADRPRIQSLVAAGARLAADTQNMAAMNELGCRVHCTADEALQRSAVVIDCTPKGVGNKNKKEVYAKHQGRTLGFVAQGSELGFGKMYASGINEQSLTPGKDRFIQIVSCNTHNIAILLDTLGESNKKNLGVESAEFLCLRRANDISQDGSFVPSPEVGRHDDERFGTHHARDAHLLFNTRGQELNLFSSAVKLNTQLMHALWFRIRLERSIERHEVLQRLIANPRVAATEKRSANTVFSFGREHGHYGRILNQTVVSLPTIHVRGKREVIGFCFTPQDGNSLMSSVAAAMWFLDPETAGQKLECLRPYIYAEV